MIVLLTTWYLPLVLPRVFGSGVCGWTHNYIRYANTRTGGEGKGPICKAFLQVLRQDLCSVSPTTGLDPATCDLVT